MKIFKIILGFLLIYGAGNEFINASNQLGSFFNPGIILGTLIMLLLSSWLLGSGFSGQKFKFKSFDPIKYFILSLLTFLVVCVFSLGSKSAPSDFVEINGLTIPLGKCIEGNRRIIPDKNERKEFCNCLIEKITNETELKLKYQDKLENDNLNAVIEELKATQKFQELGIDDCMKSIKMEWTDIIVNSMKKVIKNGLIGSEIEQSNDIDKYCNCLVDEYRKYPLNKINNEVFMESPLALEINEKCQEQSLR